MKKRMQFLEETQSSLAKLSYVLISTFNSKFRKNLRRVKKKAIFVVALVALTWCHFYFCFYILIFLNKLNFFSEF
jgi:hypothetical protein